MNKGNVFAALLLCLAVVLAGCKASNTTKGTSGILISNKMDKQKEELEKIQGAQVESFNEGEAIKVTFESGIFFATNSSTLNQVSKDALTQFAGSLKANPDTDVRIHGHTDASGNDQINIPLSQQRAQSVMDYLIDKGVNASRMTSQGMGASLPVADNSTSVGKARNRRVELYITPNAKMLQEAKLGTLK